MAVKSMLIQGTFLAIKKSFTEILKKGQDRTKSNDFESLIKTNMTGIARAMMKKNGMCSNFSLQATGNP